MSVCRGCAIEEMLPPYCRTKCSALGCAQAQGHRAPGLGAPAPVVVSQRKK